MQTELSVHHTEDCSPTLLSVLCLHNKHTSKKSSPVQQSRVFVTHITLLRCVAQTPRWCHAKLSRGLFTAYC